MKRFMTMVLSGGLVLGLFANCGQNNNTPGGATGMSAMCYYQQTSNNSTYNYNGYSGYSGMPCNYNYSALSGSGFTQANTGGFYQTSSAYGVCSSASQAVVYSPSKGLGCVDSTRLMMSGQVVTYTLNQATQTFVPSSSPSPYYNQQGYNGYNGYNSYPNYGGNGFATNGMLTVLRVCDTIELCPSGQTCRSPVGPTSVNTGVGLCYF